MPKNWCFWIVVLEKTFESPLGFKEIKPVNPKWNQIWIFIRRTDAELRLQYLPPNMKSWLIRKIPDAGKDGRQKENGMTEDVMVGWHHWLSEHEFEQAPGDGEGQGSLACSSPWGCRVGHSWATEQQSCPFKFLLVYLWKNSRSRITGSKDKCTCDFASCCQIPFPPGLGHGTSPIVIKEGACYLEASLTEFIINICTDVSNIY